MKYDYEQFFESKLRFIADNSLSILDVGGQTVSENIRHTQEYS